MKKTDLKKTHKHCYSAGGDFRFIKVPSIQYITYKGKGDPNKSEDFQHAMGVLYGLAYTIKFTVKEDDHDFTVMPLEGQWWAEDPRDFRENRKNKWFWKMMIAVPDFIDGRIFEAGKTKLKDKKDPPGLEKAALETIEDGEAVQYLHIGSYSEEGPGIAKMHSFISEKGYRLRGHHREIYLSNPQRTPEEKLKTIIRHPVEKVK
ncbi:MAG: GyrI-like domain-containing protein [Spirochaetia bacterium]